MALCIIDFPIDTKIRKHWFLNNEWANKDFFLFRTTWHVIRIKKTSVMNRFLPPLGGLKNVWCFHDLELRKYNRCLHQYFINIWFFFFNLIFNLYKNVAFQILFYESHSECCVTSAFSANIKFDFSAFSLHIVSFKAFSWIQEKRSKMFCESLITWNCSLQRRYIRNAY